MSYREAILNGVKSAEETHLKLGTRHAVESKARSNVDVFGSLRSLNVTVLFRPLDGLLGACLDGGVIISTNRPLSVQRFTGAHELGHIEMKHPLSLDDEEIIKGNVNETVEIEANAFGAEFLLPRWLLNLHARLQGWNAASMAQPLLVYQLSLRAGASYEATVRALEKHGIIDAFCSRKLLDIQPKTIKQDLLPGYNPENWYRDVWLITKSDEGGSLEGQPDDLFLFRLNEKSGAGYLWDFETANKMGFAVLSDTRTSPNQGIGADVVRSLALHSPKLRQGQLFFTLQRPWQQASPPAEQLKIKYNLYGKEIGLPRVQRPSFDVAA